MDRSRPEIEIYTSGTYWEKHPDFLASQAPGKVAFLSKFIDFEATALSGSPPSFSIVEIGCGAGRVISGLCSLLRELFPDTQILGEGYDLSPLAIEKARERSSPVDFVCGDFSEAGKTWDLGMLVDVIEHVKDPDEFVRLAAERCRHFVVGFAMDHNLANILSKKRRAITHKSGHISLFNESRARLVCSRHGRVLRSRYFPNPPRIDIKRPRHLLSAPLKLFLPMISRRLKGKLIGGESIYLFVESTVFRG